MPALFRLLYGTGLRIGEALALKNEDVNLADNYLLVRDSKNGKERIIPISDSLSSVCKEYVWHRERLPMAQKTSEYFFIRADGMRCGQGVNKWFKRCIDSAGILHGATQSPRIHDLSTRLLLPPWLLWQNPGLICTFHFQSFPITWDIVLWVQPIIMSV